MDAPLATRAISTLGGAAAGLLFERLPDRIFSPLASGNRVQYWTLLCALHRRRFGSDAPLAPSDGFTNREITRDIEDVLAELDWQTEEGEDPATPLGIRANMVLQRLTESGWLRTERYGIEKRLSMAPAVSQFLSGLITFAETGPVFVAGKIRSIEANIKLVADGGEGDSLLEAAEQTRNLLEHVRNTGLNVRDVMQQLTPELSTGEYVRRFFSDYIETLFVGDYRELHTKEHPLSRRMQILDIVEQLAATPTTRARLLAWYESRRCGGNAERAGRMLERDFDRLRELSRIDEYLDRLDAEVRRANKRALAFLDYRLRSLRPLDEKISAAIAVLSGDDATVQTPFSPGGLGSEDCLAEPRRATVRAPADGFRRVVPTERDIALMRVTARAREARSITAPALAAFVQRQTGDRHEIDSCQLELVAVEDIVAKQSLISLAMAIGSQSPLLKGQARVLARGFDVIPMAGEEPAELPLAGRPFQIRIRKNTGDK